MTKALSFLTQSSWVYFYCIFAIQFFAITGSFFKRSTVWPSLFVGILLWLAFPFFYGLTLNVLRQGMAFVFILYALDRAFCEEKRSAVLFMCVAVFFHYSSLLYLFAYLLSRKIRLKKLLLCLVLCVLFSASGASLLLPQFLYSLISSLPLAGGIYYQSLMQSGDYVVGFKVHFLIFSCIPLLMSWLVARFKVLPHNLVLVLRLYVSLLCVYFLLTGLQFNDRFAIMAWMLIPVMACFFISKRNSHLYILTLMPVVAGCMFFALFYNVQ